MSDGYDVRKRYTFIALKDGAEVGRIQTHDTQDKERSARRYFKRRGVDFDRVEFVKVN